MSSILTTLADPTRRELLERLAGGPQPVHVLAAGLNLARSSISEHLTVLRRAGLVEAERDGREMIYRRREPALAEAGEWIARFRHVQLRRAETAGGPGSPGLHLSNVTVPVLDHDRARGFYTTAFGFTLVNDRTVDGFRWISVLPPGGTCAIGLVKAPSAGVWTGISLVCPDIHKIYQRWQAAGVQFHGPPAAQTWGAQTAIFADVDGNRFQLVEQPT